MQKILFVNTTFDKGGAARVARDLFECVRDEFDVVFAYGRGGRSTSPSIFKFGYSLEFFLHIFLVRFLGLEGFGSYFSTRKLIGFIGEQKPDLVHLHNLHGYYVNFFMLIEFLKKESIPVVWTLHDEWPITWLPAHSMGCGHCKSGTGVCVNTYNYPANYLPLFLRYMLRKKREVFSAGWKPTLVCPSQWLANSVHNSFLSKFNTEVVSNGVDTNIFKPLSERGVVRAKYGLPLDKKIILFSASNLNDTSKGVQYIIDAAKFPINREHLFVGVGGGTIEDSENIRGIEYIYDKESFADLCAAVDLYCLTSTAETFSLAAAEALACGIPVVGFDIPVVREIVNDNVGALVEPRNVYELAGAIADLLSSDQKRIQMGLRGRDLIVSKYSDAAFCERYADLYRELLK